MKSSIAYDRAANDFFEELVDEAKTLTEQLIALAIQEDVGTGDITSELLVPGDLQGEAQIISREPLVVCGHPAAETVFAQLDPSTRYARVAEEGSAVEANAVIAKISGSFRTILTGERTALNLLQRMSGIATLSRRLQGIAGTTVRVLDTRKTTPGMRELEKYAVRIGGASNHRIGLFDAVLIKNNHVDALGGDVFQAVTVAKEGAPAGMKVEVEVRDFDELRQALDASANSILLDNMTPEEIRQAVQLTRASGKQVELEASGGITEANLRDYAETGVDCISLGALTHSVRSVDISLRYLRSQ